MICPCALRTDDAPKALEMIGSTRANLAVVDLALKHSSAWICSRICVQPSARARVGVSMYDEAILGERAIRAGARGYINKQEATKISASLHSANKLVGSEKRGSENSGCAPRAVLRIGSPFQCVRKL